MKQNTVIGLGRRMYSFRSSAPRLCNTVAGFPSSITIFTFLPPALHLLTSILCSTFAPEQLWLACVSWRKFNW